MKRDEIVRASHRKLTSRTQNENIRDKTIWSCYMLRFLAYGDRSCTELKDLLVRIFFLFKTCHVGLLASKITEIVTDRVQAASVAGRCCSLSVITLDGVPQNLSRGGGGGEGNICIG